jgi:tetrahydromethanopterin S-methyltransferase subunit G
VVTESEIHHLTESQLCRKGILDEKGRPTPLAFDLLPLDNARHLVGRLVRKNEVLYDDWIRASEEKSKAAQTSQGLEKTVVSLRNEVGVLQSRIGKFEPLEKLAAEFTGFPVNERVMAALISLNPIEAAIKKKLEELKAEIASGISFDKLYELLRSSLLEKEHRKLPHHLLSPTDFYRLRSKIDHWAYKIEDIEEEELQLIVKQCLKFVKEIFGKP